VNRHQAKQNIKSVVLLAMRKWRGNFEARISLGTRLIDAAENCFVLKLNLFSSEDRILRHDAVHDAV